MKKIQSIILVCLLLVGCAGSTSGTGTPTAATQAVTTATAAPTESTVPTVPSTSTSSPSAPPQPSQAATTAHAGPAAAISTTVKQIARTSGGIPSFDHIVVIVLENHGYNEVINSPEMPNFNRLAQQNVLLTQYYAVAHPSLPNYLALIGGSTFGVTTDCGACYVNAPSLPDQIEAAGRTWKTYQENMPAPCNAHFAGQYDVNHDPFVYFDPIRTDTARCQNSVVPLTQLSTDLSANQLPNFAFIVPNICNDAHSCRLTSADSWLGGMITQLQASPALGQNSAIFIIFDEASGDSSSCCGLPARAGGRVPAVLISPLAKSAFQDSTPYSHYSLLKTILDAWNLPGLGKTLDPATQAITAPWK